MPQDFDAADHPGYSARSASLTVNPFPPSPKVKKKKKRGGRSSRNGRKMGKSDSSGSKGKLKKGLYKPAVKLYKPGPGLKLIPNEKLEYKVFEFGNYPTLSNGKPRGGVLRLMLPADADWTTVIPKPPITKENDE